MAEIVRTETRVQRRHTIGDRSTFQTERITTVVTSTHGSNARMLRDFVAALDDACAPDSVLIEAHRSGGGSFSGFTAQWTEEADPPDPPE